VGWAGCAAAQCTCIAGRDPASPATQRDPRTPCPDRLLGQALGTIGLDQLQPYEQYARSACSSAQKRLLPPEGQRVEPKRSERNFLNNIFVMTTINLAVSSFYGHSYELHSGNYLMKLTLVDQEAPGDRHPAQIVKRNPYIEKKIKNITLIVTREHVSISKVRFHLSGRGITCLELALSTKPSREASLRPPNHVL